MGEYSDASAVGFNKTAVMTVIRQLTAGQRQTLLEESGVSSLEELESLLRQHTMRVENYEQPYMQYAEFRMSKFLLLYVPPILIIIGTFGNMFAFLVLRRRSMIKVSTYFYLACLAVADLFVLYVGLLRMWIGELTGMDLQNQAMWLCKLTVILGYIASDTAVWIIMAVTVERFIVVCYPFKANQMCNVLRAKKVILGLVLLMFAINLHFLWTVESVEEMIDGRNVVYCRAVEPYSALVNEAWPWVDACIYSFLPFVFIIMLNIMIINQVVKAHNSRERMQGVSERQKLDGRRQSTEGTKLTIMLLTVSFSFLITTLPMNVSLIVTTFWNQMLHDPHKVAKFTLVKSITELLMYVNHSMNFFLYCATGKKFRQQIMRLLCQRESRTTWLSMTDNSPKAKQGIQNNKDDGILCFSKSEVTCV
ncbi:FMRFamide receptor-like [Gigantopelta aegis]|uniref:FMRFamide receptor-like n=1 Tax=Gigantopelta aegis TaxID=1735272 RepID=UPI001B8894FD|nr:FMRFamide receptor-like [Gigantopelta aegis]